MSYLKQPYSPVLLGEAGARVIQSDRPQHYVEASGLGVTEYIGLLLQQERDRLAATQPRMPLVLALQFWKGDQDRALKLARMLADIERGRRGNILFAFCRRFDVPMTGELWNTGLHVGRKFSVTHIQSPVEAEGHPDGCFGLWSGTAQKLYEAYTTVRGWKWANVFFFEPDGGPTCSDWIDRLIRAHIQTLQERKRVTAPLTGRTFTDWVTDWDHANGNLLMHLSCWGDHRSLRLCTPGVPWDLMHAQVLLSEMGTPQPILNISGAQNITADMYLTFAQQYCWLANVKDNSARAWAKEYLLR